MADITTIQDSFAYDNWSHLLADDKVDLCQQLSDYYADQFGIPHVEVFSDPTKGEGEFGGWNGSRISLNANLFENGTTSPSSAIDTRYLVDDSNHQLYETVAHETRHAYQTWALQHPEEFVARAEDKEAAIQQLHDWQLNEGHYERNGPGYFAQPQEQDAWNFGQSEANEAFEGIEARNGAEPWEVTHKYQREQNNVDEIRRAMEEDGSYQTLQTEMEQGCEAQGLDTDYSYYASDQYAGLRDVSVDEAYNNLNDYYESHGLMPVDDYEIYSNDPEWQKLNNEMRRAGGQEVIRYPQNEKAAEHEHEDQEELNSLEGDPVRNTMSEEEPEESTDLDQEDLDFYTASAVRDDEQYEDESEDLDHYNAASDQDEEQNEQYDAEDLNSYHVSQDTDISRTPSEYSESAENTANTDYTEDADEEMSAEL